MDKLKEKYSMKKIIITIGVILVGFLYYIEIKTLGFAIPCYFYKLTGLKCPGCGVTGVALSVLRGDLKSTFQCNLGLMLLSPIIVPLFATCWYRWITNRSNNIKIINRISIFCVIFLLLWTVFRNIYGY